MSFSSLKLELQRKQAKKINPNRAEATILLLLKLAAKHIIVKGKSVRAGKDFHTTKKKRDCPLRLPDCPLRSIEQ